MSLEIVRLSQQGKDQLIKLKRHTGITQWNTLCRWALCVSLADSSTPLVREIVTDSNVEMSWKTFAGAYGDIYLALLRQRCYSDGLDLTDENLQRVMNMHIHRGIGHLAGDPDVRSIEGLLALAAA